jgi:hypothetical protein
MKDPIERDKILNIRDAIQNCHKLVKVDEPTSTHYEHVSNKDFNKEISKHHENFMRAQSGKSSYFRSRCQS